MDLCRGEFALLARAHSSRIKSYLYGAGLLHFAPISATPGLMPQFEFLLPMRKFVAKIKNSALDAV